MAGIVEYINKYGDLDFEAKPFCDVDGLILAQFSYLKMDGIVPGIGNFGGGMLLKDILSHPNYDNMFTDERYEQKNRMLFEAMAASERFGNIELNHHIDLVSRHWELQFSAVVCKLYEGHTHVVYRGTDESIIGWKEDFNMAFSTPVPAQIKAVDYLNYVSERVPGQFSIGGHSKGGNLAVYAAMKCSDVIRERITRVYSYDGPGFTAEALKNSDFEKIKPIIRKLVPHSSIVGMLLQNQEEYSVVLSRSFGILQHDPFNWVVEDDDFVYEDAVDELFAIQNSSINEWAENTNPEQMKVMVNNLYQVIEKTGISDLNDIKGNYSDIIKRFTVAVDELDDDEKGIIKDVFKSLLNIFIEKVKNQSSKSIKDEWGRISKTDI